ncbi:FmdB family transcriptional regulator [Xylanimonas oleitrophica]|uniref:FmdB family transcriptional regulator n=1 Tax=Xylanimonas oleitrophica TaxID=2607479 RepID=A0A2W5WSU7_9MICO|nr:FmdB family zinc ribbon protein [Xylanimonas oleitrophica]PZR54200.1 FmdB family transcriptional regulator [Xylanimonas oleitrophica]
MPTYAYRCADCGHAFDIHQSFSDDALTECPECGGALRKQYGSVGVTFKGSGFYRTDSRGSSGSSSSSSSSSTSSSSSGSKASA